MRIVTAQERDVVETWPLTSYWLEDTAVLDRLGDEIFRVFGVRTAAVIALEQDGKPIMSGAGRGTLYSVFAYQDGPANVVMESVLRYSEGFGDGRDCTRKANPAYVAGFASGQTETR